MIEPKLSYILTTYNKLDYLKITLPYLLAACYPDEEIVIVDGGSSDGTVEYLQALLDQKKIHYFISEKDFGEAHGTNKAILAAKGQLLKIITDDDVFDFEALQRCKKFMLEHPSVDILGFDGYACKINKRPIFEKSDFNLGFTVWEKNKTPFLFCGLSFLLRKSSIALMGLFNVNYKIIDMEYAIRVSGLKTSIAFYTAPAFVNIVNPSSNSINFYEAIREEQKKLSKIYPSIKINFKLNNPVLRLKEKLSLLIKTKNQLPVYKKNELMGLYDHTVKESYKILKENKNPSEVKIRFSQWD